MASTPLAAIVLAAGKGTRMRSNLHKVLHPIAGKPMIMHLLDTVDALAPSKKILVVGDRAEQLRSAIDDVEFALQTEQFGTGHAVQMALPALNGFSGDLLVLYGDVPFVPLSVMEAMQAARESASLVVLGFEASVPGAYGRLITDEDGSLARIVEFKDANETERAVTLCNSGMMLIAGDKAATWLEALDNNNAAGEYYLTDLVEIARDDGATSTVVTAAEHDVMGVNSRIDLAAAEAAFQALARINAMESGVTLMAPETVFFSHDTVIGRDVTIEPSVVFGPGVTVADGVTIKAFTHLEGATIHEDASVGPYARLRPGADIGAGSKIGNFVEIKKAKLDRGVKVSHLTYIGDATVGAEANIGAGTITCNYDGFLKYQTNIGAGAFIGSNSALVAPVNIGAGVIVGAGSVITKDVPSDALAVSRAKQRDIKGYAAKFRSEKAAEKAEKNNTSDKKEG
ncbi:bifunctional UDP-N-acetylglucosamine diphosphorylase/glucosamine-1-phosphate N-acetyltransferase GlmU [Kordiimonas aquimaris]|uniref:bifunctional UDP-N-acetylglucosamine diphosphorylase/glucosamine-1-phosphate N-acetyltransferase GlmU n=1 Tax=Kordiimonas aquimaris TaxID=707591 RepID=UPI0021CE1A0A|nr:bifunctional UDP-N-acetylglucosamine diphosphorylase/glucosamine-1-phosphate N-acetyltransferase GlmU [Kordiimonas aquimaris]